MEIKIYSKVLKELILDCFGEDDSYLNKQLINDINGNKLITELVQIQKEWLTKGIFQPELLDKYLDKYLYK